MFAAIMRDDLARVREASERHGFHLRYAAGLDMLLYGDENKAARGVHLILSDAPMAPEQVNAYGRDKDRVHVRAMDSVGLITSDVEGSLPGPLRERMRHVRATQ